ncbi:MAG: carbohydrate ABC transporter substrate-binding protein, partial [Lachnospiraceae bacterium]|nr:carbohydrate ABC transporter substrate-binding protein [Lachnospiraceae bacterium]
MRMRKALALTMVTAMTLSLAACGGSDDKSTSGGGTTGSTSSSSAGGDDAQEGGVKSYADLELGKDFTDLKVKISVLNHRTDLSSDDYGGVTWKEYLENFNKDYPGIEVDMNTDTDYGEDSLVHLQSGDYETVMMIPTLDAADLSTYFMPYGDLETMKTQINYAQATQYDGQVYGVPSTANAQG